LVVRHKQLLKLLDFLQGEQVYQGDLANPTAQGYVSNNNGWQIGPRLLKVSRLYW